MERKIEIVKLTHNGKTTTWEICEEAERYEGRRAYLQGSSTYYDIDVFERGAAKADSVERIAIN